MQILARLATIAGVCAFTCLPATLASADDQATIENAMSAAPKAVAANATVVTFDDKMEMKVLKKGSNNFTCMPDDPSTPTNDPMCADENGMEWVHAWITRTEPPSGKIGLGYMLQGETAASNTDPYAPPPADGKWSEAGPHIMILNSKSAMSGYPRPGNDPDPTQPFVMWQDTPYEHLMIPVPGEN
jgi:hypothetical protein